MAFDERHPLHLTYRIARRIVIAMLGFTVLIAGVAMMVLPGPAFIVIPVGLGILGLEFAWARRWLRQFKEKGQELADTVTRKRNAGTPPPK